jgi:beta-galactosidase
MQYVEEQARRAGIVVPFINNDAYVGGHNAPGTGVGQVDVYARDLYPMDFECDDVLWQKGDLRDAEFARHLNVSGSTPYAIAEFQGGSPDYWAGPGLARCADKFNAEYTRVHNKANYASGVKIFSTYMVSLVVWTRWGRLTDIPGLWGHQLGKPGL